MLVLVALIYAPAAGGWTWPVEGPVLRPFALGDDPYAAGQHRGIDIGSAPGTTVRAATSGTVTFAGTVPAGGRTVTVRTSSGLSVTHVELGAISVVRGAEVAEGDELGTIGPAEHVHLGVRVAADPHGYLDPLQFLPAGTNSPGSADTESSTAVQSQLDATQPGPVDVAIVGHRDTKPEPAVGTQPPAAAGEPKAAPATAEATDPAAPAEVETPSPPTAEPKAAEPAPAQLDVEQADTTIVAEGGETTRVSPDRALRKTAEEADTKSHARRSVTPRRPSRRLDSHSPPAIVRNRPRTEVERPQLGVPAEPVALRAGLPVESGRTASASRAAKDGTGPAMWKVAAGAALGLLAVAVLAGPAAGPRRRCRPDARRVSPSMPTMTCSRRPARPRRLIHPCVRAVQPGWAVPAPQPCAALNRPLPRRRRRLSAVSG